MNAARTAPKQEATFRATVLRQCAAWVALIVLMSASLASAYLHLGTFNLIAGLAIAAIKSLIVVWLFMKLRLAPASVRIAGAAALFMLAVLFTLSGVDYLTRLHETVGVERPQQIEPVVLDHQGER